MKQTEKLSIIIFLILLFFITSPSAAKTILRMNHQFPATTTGSRIDQWFADEVKKATNGEVEIKIYWSNGLGAAKENLRFLRNGYIDMAAMSPGYFPDELPFHGAPNSIPMGMENICQASAIMKLFLAQIPAFAEEARQNKIRAFFFHLLNPYLLVTRTPVTQFSDLKGMKIRTWGEDMPRLIKAADAVPVTLFLPDIYPALSRGVIDGCPFSADLVVAYKIHELAKHITEVVMWEGPSWGVWMSEKTWEKLSPEHQRVFSEISDKVWQKDLEITGKAEREAREFLKAQGVKFHPFPEEELAKWRAANPDFFDDWIKKMENLGKGEVARHTVKLWKEMREAIKCTEFEHNSP